jgi:ubiquinone/menaquinone biosynthesis C-methylase UbiE
MSLEDPYFWLERMIAARLEGEPHKAMYHCSLSRWDYIQQCHRTTLHAHITKGSSIVDVGCGNGCLSECLPPDVTYHGIDLNPYLIAWARSTYSIYKSLTFTVADGKCLDHIPDKHYDYCVSRSVIGCLSEQSPQADVERLVNTIERISKCSIMLGFTDPNEAIIKRHP